MRRFLDSLYGRLVLVLLVALGASYATMYFLFLAHIDETRASNLARTTRLVELNLQTLTASELPSLKGMRLASSPPADALPVAQSTRAGSLLHERLSEELGREVSILSSGGGEPGLWINLRTPGQGPLWMFVATRKPFLQRNDFILEALLAGFAVFLAGGMVLMWQVQRPIKAVGRALAAVGENWYMAPVPVSGAGEARELSRRFNETVERLRRYEEDRVTMLAGVAHDLRTPITRLRLLMELEEGSRNAQIAANLSDIERITEQFLVYARGIGDEPTEERTLDLFVEEVTAGYESQGVALRCELKGTRAAIRPNSLRRALINLIENALVHGAAPVLVRVSAHADGACIAVEDNGGGIAPGQMELALRPFSRLNPSRGGTGHCGLGLVIASRVAEGHRGTLHLLNRAPRGLVVEIRLPALKAA